MPDADVASARPPLPLFPSESGHGSAQRALGTRAWTIGTFTFVDRNLSFLMKESSSGLGSMCLLPSLGMARLGRGSASPDTRRLPSVTDEIGTPDPN